MKIFFSILVLACIGLTMPACMDEEAAEQIRMIEQTDYADVEMLQVDQLAQEVPAERLEEAFAEGCEPIAEMISVGEVITVEQTHRKKSSAMRSPKKLEMPSQSPQSQRLGAWTKLKT